MIPKEAQPVITRAAAHFHLVYYTAASFGETWYNTYWFGIPVLKCPLDMWLYQEIIWEVKPDLIIETGTAFGGSAYYLATMCDALGKGMVVTIDINAPEGNPPKHPRITYITASSTAPDTIAKVKALASDKKTILVILDSDHRKDHVANELQLYHSFVSRGSYLILEDTNLNGNPVRPDFGPGPMEALNEFLPFHPEFTVDRSKEKFLLSFNPKGYLKKQ